jgi:hypothetical protein
MNNHQCQSQKSLITVRKWLLEGDDSLSPSICSPSSGFDHHEKSKSHMKKIVKRKKINQKKYDSKPKSIINWFYEFIKHIFTVYDESSLNDRTTNNTTRSIMTCSTCQFEHDYGRINTYIHLILIIGFVLIDFCIGFNQN